MKYLIFSMLMTAVFSHAAFPQEAWNKYYSSNEIQINYKGEECHDIANGTHKKLVLLQFVNRTSKTLSISFDKQIWYNGKCIGCDNSTEQHFTVMLMPGQTAAGTCEDKKAKSLYIVDRMLDSQSAALTKFELANINISHR